MELREELKLFFLGDRDEFFDTEMDSIVLKLFPD